MSDVSMPSAPALPAKRYFAPRRVLLCALPLLVLLLWIVALSSLANAGNTATSSSPARVAVHIPQGQGIAMLDLGIAVVRKPASGQLGAVVRFKRAGGAAVEVGRLSIVESGQSYQFNVSGALSGGTGEVEVAVIDRGGGPAPTGAELSISHAEIVTR